MSIKNIAVLAGDGIGPEVMQQARRVLDAVGKFNYHEAKIGGAAYEHTQSHCPDETLEICEKSDAILFGSVGGPIDQQHLTKWQNCETNSILKLRKHFNFNINIRPIRNNQNNIDLLVFRELSGGLYFGLHERTVKNNIRIAVDECLYDEHQIQAIAHAAFKSAQYRKKQLCSVDKANVLATSKLWREVVTEVSKFYPDVKVTHRLVDNCAMQLVMNPQQFDVIVTENMFGDILSDLAAALPGCSLGLIPSASLNANHKGLYEPSGGSAPDIAGKGIANPSAQILSVAMMLRYAFNMNKEADVIEAAISTVINNNIRTIDIATHKENAASTEQFVDAVIERIHLPQYF
jgi:3-isopropylmalate dehydrogenase